MTKTYVLDTNVLLNDPEAMFKFDDNHVIIPITVIEEIDNHKKDQSDLGRNSRQVARNLKECRKLGMLNEGVDLKSGGTLRIEVALRRVLDRLPLDLDEDVADNRILAVAIQCNGILVTNDSNLAIKAEGVGIKAEEYDNLKVNVDTLYTGTGKAYVTEQQLDDIYKLGALDENIVTVIGDVPSPNQCFVLYSMDNPKHSALVTYNSVMKRFDLLPQDLKTLGLMPRNSEQQFALDLLLNPDISLVTMIGIAGSGKTVTALAAGLHSVMVEKAYKKVLLLKPVISMDNKHQLGFLPGSMEEKLAPWMASYYDNIDFIMGEAKKADEVPKVKTKGKSDKFSVTSNLDDKDRAKVTWAREFIDQNILELGSLEHIRGRSLPNQYIIIDEAQSLTPHAIKTIITRAGEGTKIIAMGDIFQLDVPYLDASSNGLSYVVDKFKNEAIAGHITLTKSERSKLAEVASNIL